MFRFIVAAMHHSIPSDPIRFDSIRSEKLRNFSFQRCHLPLPKNFYDVLDY